MAGSSKARSNSSRKPANPSASKPEHAPPTQRPGGKLGIIIDRLAAKTGATADELVEATGWQRHSILGALSRLKSRGFTFQLDAHADRKAYRLVGAAKLATLSRARG
ncbi:MAG: DUF3489 domain-containing protein [Alphaproteobacteria bacterium]|nr:DUF3489 domain-containing protein [Alphaproteobacteria bacterium]